MGRCVVEGCREPTPRRCLFCRAHWRAIPADLREVWRAVRDDFNARPTLEAYEAFCENVAQIALLIEEHESWRRPSPRS